MEGMTLLCGHERLPPIMARRGCKSDAARQLPEWCAIGGRPAPSPVRVDLHASGGRPGIAGFSSQYREGRGLGRMLIGAAMMREWERSVGWPYLMLFLFRTV